MNSKRSEVNIGHLRSQVGLAADQGHLAGTQGAPLVRDIEQFLP